VDVSDHFWPLGTRENNSLILRSLSGRKALPVPDPPSRRQSRLSLRLIGDWQENPPQHRCDCRRLYRNHGDSALLMEAVGKAAPRCAGATGFCFRHATGGSGPSGRGSGRSRRIPAIPVAADLLLPAWKMVGAARIQAWTRHAPPLPRVTLWCRCHCALPLSPTSGFDEGPKTARSAQSHRRGLTRFQAPTRVRSAGHCAALCVKAVADGKTAA